MSTTQRTAPLANTSRFAKHLVNVPKTNTSRRSLKATVKTTGFYDCPNSSRFAKVAR